MDGVDDAPFNPHERLLMRTEGQIVAIPVPQIKEDDVDVLRVLPQERVNRTNEMIVAISMPQIKEDGVDVLRSYHRNPCRIAQKSSLAPVSDIGAWVWGRPGVGTRFATCK